MPIVNLILQLIHNASTLLFGVFISAAFLGIKMKRKNVVMLLLFSLVSGFTSLAVFQLLGETVAEQLYPITVHLPLIFFLSFAFKNRIVHSILSVITAYLCCQVSNWLGLAGLLITGTSGVYFSIRILVTVGVFLLLLRYINEAAAPILQKPPKTVLVLTLMPAVYYIFDYATSVYTAFLDAGTTVIVEFQGFVLCISYLVFLFVYLKQHEEKNDAEQRNRLLQMQYTQAGKEVESLRRSERTMAILRHDMRHLLSNVSQMIRNGDAEKARQYVDEIIRTTERTVPRKYCTNEMVNIIIASHEEEWERHSIAFECRIDLPAHLPCSDVELTAILSNGLENAIHAAANADPGNRKIDLEMHLNGAKLLISLKNTYAEAPVLVDGFPTTTEPGHGFGTQSIRYVAEKRNGDCRFLTREGWFILQVIL